MSTRQRSETYLVCVNYSDQVIFITTSYKFCQFSSMITRDYKKVLSLDSTVLLTALEFY
jgi:hypothetical protein